METDENKVEVTPEAEPTLEVELEAEPTPEPTPEAPKVDWQKEALKYKAIAQRYAKKAQGEVPTPKKDLPVEDKSDARLSALELAEKKRQFGYEHGLSPDETDAVFKLSPNPTKEVLEDPFVKGGLASLRAKRKVAENTPKSSRSASFVPPKGEQGTTDARQKALDEFVAKRFG